MLIKKIFYWAAFVVIFGMNFSNGIGVCLANTNPIGYLDVVDANGNAAGWALDPDAPSQAITIHFYADNPAGAGILIGTTIANAPRPDVNKATKYAGDHGFNWQLPVNLRSGYHTIYAYAIDTAGGNNPQLTQSPKTIGTKPNGNSQISATFSGSPIVVKTCERTAGAVCSITWKGKEFINTTDHGREMQSASSFDGYHECYNPTEAGSGDDGSGAASTSVLRSIGASGNVLTTQTQMAFWLHHGETCGTTNGSAGSAVNEFPLSNHILDKKVTIGFGGIPNVIEYLANFTIPENHSSATFEAVTGYMPPDFNKFWTYDPQTKKLEALSNGPGEQQYPVILSTQDGNYAMGIYSPDLPQGNLGYGRWSFARDTMKWNCVFREGAITAGKTLSYRCYPIIGSLKDVTDALDQMSAKYPGNSAPKGFFDNASCSSFSGWACDANDYAQPLSVHFYADGQAGSGTFIGATTAGAAREAAVGGLCGGNANHGFNFTTPDSLKDGQIHTIYAYGINIPSGTNPLLDTNAKTITCALPVCASDCSTAGVKKCLGNGVLTCALSGGCLKWGAAAACAAGNTCSDGACASECVAKTCVTLGNYECGSQSNGCGATIDCGACVAGKTCSNGKCVANCASHSSMKCDSGKLYWYNSCDSKEELAQDCGTDAATSNYRCRGNWIQSETIKKGCSNNACVNESTGVNNTDSNASGKICSAGVCVAAGTTTNPPVTNPPLKSVTQMTRVEIMARIAQIQTLMADLQKQRAAMTGSPAPAASQSATYSCTQITQNLFYGRVNDAAQVKCLQEVLKSQGYAVTVSGNYDAATKTAVAQFQQKYASVILAPYGLKSGSGNVGNGTLAKVNALLSEGH